MKLLVITDEHGAVIGTARVTESDGPDVPFGGRPVPAQGHHVHEITLPPELHHIRSSRELHDELGKLLKQRESY